MLIRKKNAYQIFPKLYDFLWWPSIFSYLQFCIVQLGYLSEIISPFHVYVSVFFDYDNDISEEWEMGAFLSKLPSVPIP